MHHWGCKPLQERGMCGQSCNSGGVGGSIQVRLHLHFTAKAAGYMVEAPSRPGARCKPRDHRLCGRTGQEGEEEGGEAMQE